MRGGGLAAALLLGLAAGAAAAQSYAVTQDPAPVGEAPSALAPRALPVSRLDPRPAASTAGPLNLASTLGVKDTEAGALADSEAVLSELGAKVEDGRVRVTLPGDVLFDFDRAEIRADAVPVLERLAGALAALPGQSVEIIGHTDAKGDDAYNQGLSERRAGAVRSWLAAREIAESRLSAAGRGEAEPVAPNARADGSDDPDGRQKNRRVEFVIGGA
ncbi:OmpA family protein [Paracoccus sanguinis]|uniref:OmpA family protein n=1 Tax=Paracoccus sanguinis TaxID=1545044 RepID=UPI000690EFD7|nr:OmpA family protein [Paracoccus sanguinis]